MPDSFIYEILDGRPLYYKGYKQAIKNSQNAESIRGTSSFQASVLSHILSLLFNNVYLAEHRIFTGNPGISLNRNDNLTGHILIYDKQTLPGSKISKHYLDVPAMLQIEVDIRAELEGTTETGYIKKKTQKLLDFGTSKVIWIFTGTQQVLIASAGDDWKWVDWNKAIELWQGSNFCIGEYLKKEGITVEDE